MNILLITIIPSIVAITWAFCEKIKNNKRFEALIVAVLGAFVLYNGLATYIRTIFNVTNVLLHFSQLAISTTIIPLAYMYFSRQVGRALNNGTTLILWSLMILLAIPDCVIFIPGCTATISNDALMPFTINILYGSGSIYTIHTGDFIVILQAVLTLRRMIALRKMMRNYGLALNRPMHAFLIWWGCTIAFCVTASVLPTSMLQKTVFAWIYFSYYTIAISTIFVLVALKFDMHPVVLSKKYVVENDDDDEETTEENATTTGQTISHSDNSAVEPVHLDSFVQRSQEMAAYVRHIVEGSDEYLNSEVTAESVIAKLGTNRTYFARMMSAEFGIKFSTYLNNARIAHAEYLLKNTMQPINDIAYSCGFKDASYFGKKFKEHYGESPAMYRSGMQHK